MRYLLTILSVFLLACNIELSRRSEVINPSTIQVAKKDIAVMEKDDQKFLRIDEYVESLYSPNSNRESYFYRVKKLKSIFFTNNSVKIDEKGLKELSFIAKKVKSNPKYFLLLTGYTHNESPVSSFNEHLSQARNLAVKNALAFEGVSPQRVFTKPLGEYMSKNIASQENKDDKKNLKRVEITIGLIKEK